MVCFRAALSYVLALYERLLIAQAPATNGHRMPSLVFRITSTTLYEWYGDII